MRNFFRWCMRRGAAILFAVALLQLLAGFLGPLYGLLEETREMAGSHSYAGRFGDFMHFQLLISALSTAMFAFFGALVIDRLDIWLGRREAAQ